MDNYEVLSLIGEGACGRVYKAKILSTNDIVALKLIVKTKKSDKEIVGLRQECEIQRTLNHPNIIQMLDSIETDSEIIVVTEFMSQNLYELLNKEGYLSEARVKKITCDLISALYYLHSHRVLHRDLKPQNILLDENGNAKLCDFGFARSMGTGTHVLTSVKGTPLYMAPEVINAKPYDHNADLWSLGCIMYELLLGSPPFRTSCLMNLVRLVQTSEIQWPDVFSEDCKHFLQGLLQKDPEKRMSWSQILSHPFLSDVTFHIDADLLEAGAKHPFTIDLSASQVQAKEIQSKEIEDSRWKTQAYAIGQYGHNPFLVAQPMKPIPIPRYPLTEPLAGNGNPVKTSSCPSQSVKVSDSLSNDPSKKVMHSSLRSLKSVDSGKEKKLYTSMASEFETLQISEEKEKTEEEESVEEPVPENKKTGAGKKSRGVFTLHSWDSAASVRPIENEEWLVFLQKNMEEIMGGQLDCLRNHNLVSVVVGPLRNSNASCHVLQNVASMLSLPFVVDGPSEKDLENIKQVYLELKLIPNLMYASKIVVCNKGFDSGSSNVSIQAAAGSEVQQATPCELTSDELQTLERIYLLICHLVHLGDDFLMQFCDAAMLLNAASVLQRFLLLGRLKARLVTDLLAILNLILRELPENSGVVEQIVLGTSASGAGPVNLSHLLSNSSRIVRSRTCELVKQLSSCRPGAIQGVWTQRLYQDLTALLADPASSVRMSAEEALAAIRVCLPNKTG